MPTLQTSTLAGAALDWAVAMAEGIPPERLTFWASTKAVVHDLGRGLTERLDYHTDPAKMWPIIDREHISTNWLSTHWQANVGFDPESGESDADEAGPTSLIAAARCLVSHKLGPVVDVPHELVGD